MDQEQPLIEPLALRIYYNPNCWSRPPTPPDSLCHQRLPKATIGLVQAGRWQSRPNQAHHHRSLPAHHKYQKKHPSAHPTTQPDSWCHQRLPRDNIDYPRQKRCQSHLDQEQPLIDPLALRICHKNRKTCAHPTTQPDSWCHQRLPRATIDQSGPRRWLSQTGQELALIDLPAPRIY